MIEEITLNLIRGFWLLLPAGFANMAPVFFRRLNILNIPIDLGICYRGHHLFGSNKTYRGLLAGVLTAILIVFLQKVAYQAMPQSITNFLIIIDYTNINIFVLGFLLGFGALFGDIIASFFKRQLDIEPGKPWIPFDQLDWVLGSLIFLNIYIRTPLILDLLVLPLFVGLHFLVKRIGFSLKISENKL